MVKARFIVSVLSAIASFTLVASPAHAGGGMGAGSGLTTCRLILNSTPNESQTLLVQDEFLPAGDQVKVGAAVLVCDLPALGTRLAGAVTGNPIPVTNDTRITCYSVSGADTARIGATMQDPFTEDPSASTGTQAVQIGAIQLVCVPSVITPQ